MSKGKKLNNVQKQEEKKVDQQATEFKVGQLFTRKDDKSSNPTIFECISVNEIDIVVKFKEGTLTIPIKEVYDLLVPYTKEKEKGKEKEEVTVNAKDTKTDKKDKVITIKAPAESKEKESKPKVETVQVNKKEDNKLSTPRKSEPLVGPGRGRIEADIKCYDSSERKVCIKEFSTFADARNFLGLKAIGNNIEKASDTGKPYKGYWWKVEDIVYPEKVVKKEKGKKETPIAATTKDKKNTVKVETPIIPIETLSKNNNKKQEQKQEELIIQEDIFVHTDDKKQVVNDETYDDMDGFDIFK